MAKSGPGSALQFMQVMKIVKFLRAQGVECKGDEGYRSIAEKMCVWANIPPIAGKTCVRAAFRDFLARPDVSKFRPATYTDIVQMREENAAKSQAKKARKNWSQSYLDRQTFYLSTDWRYIRYEALKRSRGVCELCGASPTTGKMLHVDHIKPRSKYPDLEFEIANLQVLCEDCNLGKGNRDEIDWRRIS